MVGIPSDILDLCPSIFKFDFKSVDIPWLKVKPLYAFIEKLPFLALLVEFKVALLLNEPLAGLSVGAYDEGLYVFPSVASDDDKQNEQDDWKYMFCWECHVSLISLDGWFKPTTSNSITASWCTVIFPVIIGLTPKF